MVHLRVCQNKTDERVVKATDLATDLYNVMHTYIHVDSSSYHIYGTIQLLAVETVYFSFAM